LFILGSVKGFFYKQSPKTLNPKLKIKEND